MRQLETSPNRGSPHPHQAEPGWLLVIVAVVVVALARMAGL